MTETAQPSDAEKTAHRFNLLTKDAKRAAEYLETWFDILETGQPDPRGDLHSALMVAAITVYTRSFKRSERTNGEADAKAALSKLEVSNDARLAAIHLQVITARDTMIAHSDWSMRSTQIVRRFNAEEAHGTAGVLRATQMTEGWENINERAFLDLALTVYDQARQLVSRLDRLGK